MKDLTKAEAHRFFEALVGKLSYKGGYSEVKMSCGDIYNLMQDEIVSIQRDDAENQDGWCWHTVVKTLSGVTLLDEFGGDWIGETPYAHSKPKTYIGRIGNGY